MPTDNSTDTTLYPAAGGRRLGALVWVVLLLLLFLGTLFNPLVTVGAGQRTVLFSLRGGTLSASSKAPTSSCRSSSGPSSTTSAPRPTP